MKLTEVASKPQLIKITLDEPEIIEQYNDEIEFWTWDRQPLEKYLALVGQDASMENMPALIDFAKDLILDESGAPILKNGEVLPTLVMTLAVNKVVSQMGKS
jgi:hypothetical protein